MFSNNPYKSTESVAHNCQLKHSLSLPVMTPEVLSQPLPQNCSTTDNQLVVETNIQIINGSKCLMNTLTWPEIKALIQQNNLQNFARAPPDAFEYRKFRDTLAAKNLSVYKRLVCEQLEWAPKDLYKDPNVEDTDIIIKPSSPYLFHHAADVKIMLNEFPYNFSKQVTHLLVWTKVPILSDPISDVGDISSSTRGLIDLYVKKTFIDGLGIDKENIIWFRNWSALQSVKQISHVHVLVNKLSNQQLEQLLFKSGEMLTLEEVNSFDDF